MFRLKNGGVDFVIYMHKSGWDILLKKYLYILIIHVCKF